MIYLWVNPENYADKFRAVYNEETSVDRFLLTDGHQLASEQTKGKFILDIGVTRLEITSKYDCVPNTSGVPLVNQKIVDLLLQLASDEVQFFDAEIHCKDGVLTNYKLLNATKSFVGIDHEKSICEIMPGMSGNPDFIYGFKYLSYTSGCMGKLKLARDKEYTVNLLANEEIKQAFEKAKIKGIRFAIPEVYYSGIYG